MFKSQKQRALVQMLAAKGVPWAVKFAKDAGETPAAPVHGKLNTTVGGVQHAPRGSTVSPTTPIGSRVDTLTPGDKTDLKAHQFKKKLVKRPPKVLKKK